MSSEAFRRLALTLPDAIESSHMGHPDFRVKGKIFATLWPGEQTGVVMLTPDQQALLLAVASDVFSPVKGGWGARGSTRIDLSKSTEDDLLDALRKAWCNKAPKDLLKQLDV
jgi:hypothetical protein